MRFKQFISEAKKLDLDRFYEDCAPFLEEIKGVKKDDLAMHGSKTAPSDWQITTIERRGEARNTPAALHDSMDAFFKQKFGWAARSAAMFVTGEYGQATTYGPVSLVFPIGKFQTLWSPQVYDLYHTFSDIKDARRRAGQSDQWDDLVRDAAKDAFEQLSKAEWLHNQELKRALKSSHEIMLFAPKVYIVRMWTDTHDELLASLKDKGFIE